MRHHYAFLSLPGAAGGTTLKRLLQWYSPYTKTNSRADSTSLEYIHRESSQKSTRIAPPERYRGRSSPTPPAHETSMPPSPPKPTSRRPREAHERRASSSWSWLLPQPRTLRLRHLCAQSSFLARHAAARVTGASARPRSACEIAPRHCVRVACLVRSLENKHAGSQRQYGNNVVRGSAFESAVLEHRRLLPDQANTVPFVALGAHLLRCNPSNHTRPYALQSCISIYGQCAVDVCECMPTQLYASARLVSTRSSRNSD